MPRALVTAVDSYDVGDRTVALECDTRFDDPPGEYALPEGRATVELSFLSPEIFRFQLLSVPEVGPSEGVDLEPEAVERPVDLTVREVDGSLHVETSALSVVVGLDEWSFAVRDAEGRSLLVEQRDDFDAKGNRRTHPLGFTAERINRWPYRFTDAGTSFELGPDEHVYGFGEKFTEFDKRGQTIESWVTQANGTRSEYAYKNVPFYLSTAGYGLLVDTVRKATFDVGNTSSSTLSVAVEDDTFAFVFFGEGSFDDVLSDYTALTGRPPRPPKWSFGVWLSRCGYQNRAEVEAALDGMAERDLPCDVVHLDPPWLTGLCDLRWDREAFPDPEGFVEELHDRGVRLSLWEYPYVLTSAEAFEEARDAGYLVEDGAGKPYVVSRFSWSSDRGGIVDFTNPDAVEWWVERHRPLIEMGVDVFKTDFGEYLPRDAVLANGKSGAAMRNLYPNLYTGAVYEAFREAVGDDALLWARSGWTGGQRYPVHWGGDPHTSFGAMAGSLRGGLSLCTSGYGFWSADIGGFRGEPTPELYLRWAAFGLLGMSHARFHGTTPREPWHYGEDAVEIVREFSRERYRLVPYLYTAAELTRERGLPVMRPLVLEFQDDHGARTCGTELVLGDALLVAPVLSPGGERDVYLPDAEWVDYWSGERVSGPVSIRRDVALDEILVYLRAGRLIPRQDPSEGVSPGMPDALELYGALADGEATGEVYDEDADRLRTATARREDGTLSVDPDGLAVDTVTLRGVRPGSAPDSVEVEGEPLTATEDEPAHGEWRYAESNETLVLRPG